MRILFATDLHGSTPVLEKAVFAAAEHRADLLLVGGDILGKGAVVATKRGDGLYDLPFSGGAVGPVSRAQLRRVERAAAVGGYYLIVCGGAGEAEDLRSDQRRLRAAVIERGAERLREWARHVSSTFSALGHKMPAIFSTANDDPLEIDAVLMELEDEHGIIFPLGRAVDIEGFNFGDVLRPVGRAASGLAQASAQSARQPARCAPCGRRATGGGRKGVQSVYFCAYGAPCWRRG